MKLKLNTDLFSVILALTTVLVFVLLVTVTGKRQESRDLRLTFTDRETEIIGSSDSIMRVLTTDVPEDSAFLRGTASELTRSDMASPLFSRLSRLMVATMADSSMQGVGIAAPQVGIAKRVVAVQRFDKDGEPVEVYPNLRIVSFSGEPVPGREGCLSIPGYYGVVKRYPRVVVSYSDTLSFETVSDTVSGFTAVIFQHEADHLDGVLYIDRADSVFVQREI